MLTFFVSKCQALALRSFCDILKSKQSNYLVTYKFCYSIFPFLQVIYDYLKQYLVPGEITRNHSDNFLHFFPSFVSFLLFQEKLSTETMLLNTHLTVHSTQLYEWTQHLSSLGTQYNGLVPWLLQLLGRSDVVQGPIYTSFTLKLQMILLFRSLRCRSVKCCVINSRHEYESQKLSCCCCHCLRGITKSLSVQYSFSTAEHLLSIGKSAEKCVRLNRSY